MTPHLGLTGFWRDILYAIRSSAHRRHRLVSMAIVLIVALGLGSATVVFSVADALLFRDLPFPASHELVSVELTTARERGRRLFGHAANTTLYAAWRKDAAGAIELAGFQGGTSALTGRRPARTLQLVGVTPNAIDVLGVRPLHGRGFAEADDARGAAPTVILSEALWRQLFGGDAGAIGRRVALNGREHEVVGVMPRGFHIPLSIPASQQQDPELWVPLAAFQDLQSWPADTPLPLEIFGRVRTATPLAAIQEQLDRVAQQVRTPGTGSADVAQVTRLQEARARTVRTPLWLLSGAVGLLLLLAGLNVANLLMARTIARDRELAARIALGASPSRLVRQLLTEGLAIVLAGGLLGIGLAYAGMPALVDLGASYLPDARAIAIDGRVLTFSLAITLIAGVAVSVWPAMTTLHRSPMEVMTSRTPAPRRATRRLMRVVVGLEIAVAVVVLTAMGLLARSFVRLTQVSRGYEIGHVVLAGLMLPTETYPTAESRRILWRGLLDALDQEPALAMPAVSSGVPLIGGTGGVAVPAEGAPADATSPDVAPTRMAVWSVSGDYFRSIGVPILRGRVPAFAADPHGATPGTATSDGIVLDVSAARALFGRDDVIGRRIRWGREKKDGIVEAVVGDIQDVSVNVATNSRVRRITPHVYVPVARDPSPVVRISARATADPARALEAVRAVVARVAPDVAIDTLDTTRGLLRMQLNGERFLIVIIGLCGTIAVVLASAGIFALMAHSTAQRTHEIGVRLALGARPDGILRLVLREALTLAGAGAIAGIVGAIAFGGILHNVLFETSPFDLLTIVAVVVLTTSLSLLASALPARRAARVNATIALLHE